MKPRRCARCRANVATTRHQLPTDLGEWGSYGPVCNGCATALAGLVLGGARYVASVDRAVRTWEGCAAAEAVGHFLRDGRPGPNRFVELASPAVRDLLTSAALERAADQLAA